MSGSDKVFLHYTQAELERNYDQRTWDPTAAHFIDRYPTKSADARKALRYKTFSYGPDPDEVLDVFLAPSEAPTILFIHGGAWRNFDRNDFSYIATQFVRQGFHCAVANFSKLPRRRLPELVEQLRRTVVWLCNNRKEFGGRPGSLYVCGHSSGAHLSALLLTTDWPTYGCPKDVIGGASLISGSYDLEPALLSARRSYIFVSDEEKRDLSPMFLSDRIGCPVFIAYAENDTDEFRRQSREFARALERSGVLYGTMLLPSIGHFAILEELCKPGSELLKAVLAHASSVTGC